MIDPKFSFRDVKYSVDEKIFERAKNLFSDNKVLDFRSTPAGYLATVSGSRPYRVFVSVKSIDYGDCECYMGQNGSLCKHMIAVGLMALRHAGRIDEAGSSTEPSPASMDERKALLSAGLRKIKPYSGPSKHWFSYQSKLDIGAATISESCAGLNPNPENAKFLWSVIKRIDRKLANGVDDSNGTVWPVASGLVEVLAEWASQNNELYKLISTFTQAKTEFGYHQELLDRLNHISPTDLNHKTSYSA